MIEIKGMELTYNVLSEVVMSLGESDCAFSSVNFTFSGFLSFAEASEIKNNIYNTSNLDEVIVTNEFEFSRFNRLHTYPNNMRKLKI